MHVIACNEIYYIALQIHYMSLHRGGFADEVQISIISKSNLNNNRVTVQVQVPSPSPPRPRRRSGTACDAVKLIITGRTACQCDAVNCQWVHWHGDQSDRGSEVGKRKSQGQRRCRMDESGVTVPQAGIRKRARPGRARRGAAARSSLSAERADGYACEPAAVRVARASLLDRDS